MVEAAGDEDEMSIVEERDEFMVSVFSNGKPYLRNAHFLKPSLSPIDEQIPELPPLSHSSLPHSFQPREWPLKVFFTSWVIRNDDLVSWVDIMRPRYQSVWERAGIFEAIMSSTCSIKRYSDLVLGLAEKWNPKTNTFIFPWGESTISLEDVIALGGFSVVGFPVTLPCDTQELKEAEAKLVEECNKIKGVKYRRVSLKEWRDHFIGSGREDIEHEAFLSWWISRFVLQTSSDEIVKRKVFPIACRLARGQLVALGPAVLASIYSDLTLLKGCIVGFKGAEFDGDNCVSRITLCSKMELVQLWAWERFPALQPVPNVIQDSDPRSSVRWNNVEIVRVENVRTVLDSTGETLDWRPYARVANSRKRHTFYKEKEEWITIDRNSSKELVSFALCLRPSELIGFGTRRCIQQYLPHRVAMQFGIDQDVPSHVARSNKSPEMAWKNYVRPINGRKLYVPSRFFESDVTVRYSEWWKKGKSETVVQQDAIKGTAQRKRSSRKRPERIPWVKARKEDNEASIPPGFLPKLITVKPEPFVDDNCSLANAQGLSSSGAANGGSVKMEFSLTPTQKATHIKYQAAARVRSETTESKFKFSRYGKDNISKNDESNTLMEANILYSRLEARIARMERMVAELKAEYNF